MVSKRNKVRIELSEAIELRREIIALGVYSSGLSVTRKDGTSTGEERKDEGHQCTKHKPIGVSVVSREASVTDVVAGNTKQDHLDDPDSDGGQKCEGTGQSHENGSATVIRKATETPKEGNSRKTSSWRALVSTD